MLVTIKKWSIGYANLGEIMQFANDTSRKHEFKYSLSQLDRAWSTWVTSTPIVFEVQQRDGSAPVIFAIPANFMTDFASVPRALRWLYSRSGNPTQVAAVIHDYLYSSHPTQRAYADKVFRVAMQAVGEPAARAWLKWAAVRLGGLWAYRNGQKRYQLDRAWRFLS